jgi:hypothetical protein
MALISVGVVLLLDSLDVFPARHRAWPIVLLAIGAWLLVARVVGPWWASGGLFVPLALVGVGILGVLQDAGNVSTDVSVWPVVLIALGAAGLIEGMGLTRRRRVRFGPPPHLGPQPPAGPDDRPW